MYSVSALPPSTALPGWSPAARNAAASHTQAVRIRPFAEPDIPQVAALHRRVFAASSPSSDREPDAYRRYFGDVFLGPAATDGGLSSLVYEREGDIRGFLGVRPLRMRVTGRPILAALCSQFAIDPSERGLAGLQMLKACFAGPQDLSIADEAGDNARKMWEWCGGAALLPYSIHWIRPLRPAQAAIALAARHLPSVPCVAALTRTTRILDDVVEWRRARRSNGMAVRGSRHDLDEPAFLEHVAHFTGRCAVVPDYTAQSLPWIFRRLTHGAGARSVRKQLVRDDTGNAIGWFIYVIAPDRVGEVVSIAAGAGAARLVLDHLAEDARAHGAVALAGRHDPGLTPELSEQLSFLYRRGHWALAHSADAALLQALQRGNAFLSRLEGEWCLRFTH